MGVYRFWNLATYNAEVSRGLVHTEEWRTRMAEEQRLFNIETYGEPEPQPGKFYAKRPRKKVGWFARTFV